MIIYIEIIGCDNLIIKDLRKIESKNLEQILKIWEESYRDVYGYLEEEELDDIRELVIMGVRDSHSTIVAEKDGKIIGFLTVYEDGVDTIFVDKEYRREGVGAKMVNYVIDKYDVLFARVNSENQRGINFYEAIGFEKIKGESMVSSGILRPIVELVRK